MASGAILMRRRHPVSFSLNGTDNLRWHLASSISNFQFVKNRNVVFCLGRSVPRDAILFQIGVSESFVPCDVGSVELHHLHHLLYGLPILLLNVAILTLLLRTSVRNSTFNKIYVVSAVLVCI